MHNIAWKYTKAINHMLDNRITNYSEFSNKGEAILSGGMGHGAEPIDFDNPKQIFHLAYKEGGYYFGYHLGTLKGFKKLTSMTPVEAFQWILSTQRIAHLIGPGCFICRSIGELYSPLSKPSSLLFEARVTITNSEGEDQEPFWGGDPELFWVSCPVWPTLVLHRHEIDAIYDQEY